MAGILYSDCHLAIRTEQGKFSIALQDSTNFHLRSFHSFEWTTVAGLSTLENYLKDFEHLASAKNIVCSINTFANTLIPEAIYQEKNCALYLGFNFETNEQQVFTTDPLPLLDALNVYQLPEYCQTISKFFPKCKFVHESGVQIELALRLSRLNQKDAAYLFFSEQFFRLCVIQNGTLQFCNTFSHQSEMDVAYYVLYVFDQLHLKTSEIQNFASGDIEANDAIIDMLRDYIGPIQLLRTCSLAELALTEDEHLTAHRNFTLFHQALCV
jgi:hypothetical protein